jgi:hypothetical protein
MGGPTFKMANLKRSKESLSPKNVGKIGPDPYSYEHRITLDQQALDKLGLDVKDFKTGQKFHAMGHAEVASVSQHDHGNGDKTSRVELQFKRLGLKPKAAKGETLRGAVEAGIKEGSDE